MERVASKAFPQKKAPVVDVVGVVVVHLMTPTSILNYPKFPPVRGNTSRLVGVTISETFS